MRILLAFLLTIQSVFASYPGETPTYSELTTTSLLTSNGVMTEGISSSAISGANATLATPTTPIVTLTNASLSSLSMIDAPVSGKVLTIINDKGNALVINNDAGSTAAHGILTGMNKNIEVRNQESISLRYDGTDSRWRVIGRSESLLTSTSVSNTTTIVNTVDIVFANAGSGAITITLPTAVGITGKVIRFVKTDTSFNAATIDGNASETISGSTGALTTITLNTIGEIVDIMAINNNWIIINTRIPSEWVTHTPSDSSYAWGTTSSRTFRWRRVGDSIEVDGIVTLSSVVSGTMDWTQAEYLPPGLTVDTSKTSFVLGTARAVDASASSTVDDFLGVLYMNGSDFRIMTKGTDVFDATEPFTWASGDLLQFRLSGLPITGWRGY